MIASSHNSDNSGDNSGGLFCVVEGIDGSGKSTLLEHLTTALQAEGLRHNFGGRFHGLRELREPTTGPVGRRIRTHLQAGDQLATAAWLKLFFEDRAENVHTNIQPALATGDLVLQDRYFYSTAAYQGTSPEDALTIVERSLAAGFPEPDVVLYLAIEPEVAMGRIHRRASPDDAGKSLESFETLEQLQRIHRNYSRVLPAHALRLDAEHGPEQLCEIALAHMQSMAGPAV